MKKNLVATTWTCVFFRLKPFPCAAMHDSSCHNFEVPQSITTHSAHTFCNVEPKKIPTRWLQEMGSDKFILNFNLASLISIYAYCSNINMIMSIFLYVRLRHCPKPENNQLINLMRAINAVFYWPMFHFLLYSFYRFYYYIIHTRRHIRWKRNNTVQIEDWWETFRTLITHV